MRKFLLFIAAFLFLLAFFHLKTTFVQAACTCRQYECAANEIEQDLCTGGRIYCCTLPTSTPKPPTATPKPTNAPVPTTPPSCTSCPGNQSNAGCTPPSFGVCNFNTCQWGCTGDSGTCTQAQCTSWSNWVCQNDGIATRYCTAPDGTGGTRDCTKVSQAQLCTNVITGTPGPTKTPAPTSPGGNPTNTPIPTATPTLTLAYIRVRTMDSAGQNVKDTTISLCKANCTNAPCTFYGGANACVSNDSAQNFNNAEDNRGGAIKTSTYTVLGVTPMLNGIVNTANGVYSTTCRGVGAGNYCYFWTTPRGAGTREVRFILATPTPTNTPTPTPTTGPGPWIKLKDSSFISRANLSNSIPLSPAAYDSDDTTDPYYIIGSSGAVAAPTINITTLNANAKAGSPEYKAAYTPTSYAMTPANYLSYIKSRKEYQTISSANQINASGIYLYDNGLSTLDIASVPSQFNQYDVVLIFQGTININAANFNPTRSIALVADAINFSATTTSATGLFIAGDISTGSTANQGLKINGNLVAQTGLDNQRKWINQNTPSVFIVFKPDLYLDLLPYLSIANYEWKQLQ